MRPIRVLAALATLVALSAVRPAAAQSVRSDLATDSTVSASWRLANGLEVRTRHIPRAAGVAITLAVRAGHGYEPAGLEGLADLLAELHFMSAAGPFAERTRAELASVRPLGTEVRVNHAYARFTELVTSSQVPGALAHFAARLGSPTVTEASLKTAIAEVRRESGARYYGGSADVLYWRAGAFAAGDDDATLLRRAGLTGPARMSAKDAAARLAAWYQPGGAVLAVAGDLSGLDLRVLVEAAFGRLPAGEGLPDTVTVRATPGRATASVLRGIAAPAGVIAASTPAITDSLHPGFFLGMLITGASLNQAWGSPPAGTPARFQYALLDDPEVIRFYPPVPPEATEPAVLTTVLDNSLYDVGARIVLRGILDRMRYSVRWLMGGSIPDELVQRMQRDAGGLGTLAAGMAGRAVWKGDAFWADYLARFDRLSVGHANFHDWLRDPSHQTVLLLTPAR